MRKSDKHCYHFVAITKCMIKIFRGEGVVDGEGGSSDGWLKWGGGGGVH